MASPFDDFDADHGAAGAEDDAVEVEQFDHTGDKTHTADVEPLEAPAHHDDLDAFGTSENKADTHGADPFAQADSGDHHDDPLGGDNLATPSALPTNDELSFQGPTPLSLWQNERELVIQSRISKAKSDKAKALEDSRQEIAQFYKQRKEAIAKTQKSNREEEKTLKADLEALMSHGTLWEKVARMANVQPKANEDRKAARMRKLLLQLKNDRVDEDMKSAAKSDVQANGPSKKGKKIRRELQLCLEAQKRRIPPVLCFLWRCSC